MQTPTDSGGSSGMSSGMVASFVGRGGRSCLTQDGSVGGNLPAGGGLDVV